jgi:uncharacterized membrane protein
MSYIAWTLLNLTLFSLFLSYCLAAIKTIWQRLGVLPLLLILFGIFSFSSAPATRPVVHRAPGVVITGPVERVFGKVADFYIAAVELVATCKDGHVYQSNVYLTGFSCGNRWDTTAVHTEVVGSQVHYTIAGTLSWKLLGLSLYRDHQVLTGTLTLR